MSTFGTFNTARLGIYAAQKAIDVTGHNITNINTVGYTRQSLDQVALSGSNNDKYYSQYNINAGRGVLTTGLSQYRDAAFDLSYRSAISDLSSADTTLAGLQDIARILDEVGLGGDADQDDGVLLDQFNELRDLISSANTSGIEGYDALIRSAATSLTTIFNTYSDKLDDLEGNYEVKLDEATRQVNLILDDIAYLNDAIHKAEIRGDSALELKDERNLQLDKLSEYIKVDITYEKVDVGAGTMVDQLKISIHDYENDDQPVYLVHGEYSRDLTIDNTTGNQNVVFGVLNDLDGDVYKPAVITDATGALVQHEKEAQFDDVIGVSDTALYGAFQSIREFLTESGEFSYNDAETTDPTSIEYDEDALSKKGIQFYQNSLDVLAREFAAVFNALNTTDADGNDITADLDGAGNLFSISSDSNDTTGINAGNISISKGWSEGDVSILSSTTIGAPSDDRTNLARYLASFDKNVDYLVNPADTTSPSLFEGTFENMFINIQGTLAQSEQSMTTVTNTYANMANELYVSRDSITGVDLNDEASNLMTYQAAYTAAIQLMTTLDEALQTLLNMGA